MSNHDQPSSGHSSFDQTGFSVETQNRFSPADATGDYYRLFGNQKNEPLIERRSQSYSGKLPVVQIALTFILGMWGAIILGLFL